MKSLLTTYNNIQIFKKKLKANRALELKQELVQKIRSRLDECSNLFVIRLYNERTDKLQMEDYARAGNNVNKIDLYFFLL